MHTSGVQMRVFNSSVNVPGDKLLDLLLGKIIIMAVLGDPTDDQSGLLINGYPGLA